MLSVLGHAGQPLQAHDLWVSWSLDPLLLVSVGLGAWFYWRGAKPPADRVRAWCFAGGLAALVLALVSPLEPLAGALASAHMVQHLLLMLVAAPLLARSAPAGALLRGSPLGVRRAVTRARRRLALSRRHTAVWRHAPTVWLLHVGALWTWHAAVLYEAALAHEAVHAVEHLVFLVTALAFWRVVLGRGGARVSPGAGILLVFTAGMASVFLSVLLTFAETAWYPGYATTTAPWGLTPLADQRLAGVIMWVPSSAVYVGTGLTLLVGWLGTMDRLSPTGC